MPLSTATEITDSSLAPETKAPSETPSEVGDPVREARRQGLISRLRGSGTN